MYEMYKVIMNPTVSNFFVYEMQFANKICDILIALRTA